VTFLIFTHVVVHVVETHSQSITQSVLIAHQTDIPKTKCLFPNDVETT